jgi:CRISPR/Cas system-associated protein Csm6
MPNNLIIPCGTSQLLRSKLDQSRETGVGLRVYDQAYQAIEKENREHDLDPIDPEDFFKQPQLREQVNRIIVSMRSYWEDRGSYLGRDDSPFGAEIHTLIALQVEQAGRGWNPDEDHAVLLASQTRSGMFAAHILGQVLTELWGMQASEIEILVINGLSSRPSAPNAAMEHLANEIVNHVRGSKTGKNDKTWKNILVASGGFKSVIPCLSMVSLVYGLRMVYMFELSANLQSLHPIYDQDPKTRKFWQDVWKKLIRQPGLTGRESSWMRTILRGRLKIKGSDTLIY